MRTLLSLLLLLSASAIHAQPLEVYVCGRTGSEVTIDGVLDDPVWQAAERVPLVDAVDGSAATFPTDVALVWDDENLYISFTCSDPDMWATLLNRDDPLWNEEVVEVFIDPDGDGEDYAELEVSPLNIAVDLDIIQITPKWNSDIDWDIAGLQTAVTVEGTVNDPEDEDVSWTVEIAIPFVALSDIAGAEEVPSDGDEWRINLYRIERPRDEDWHLLAWCPCGRPAFHTPDRFGIVRFSTEPVEPLKIEEGAGSSSGPQGHRLSQNHPNPFNAHTLIQYALPSESHVEMILFDTAGRPVRNLLRGIRAGGTHIATWDGTDDRGHPVATGLYLCRMRTGPFAATRKALLVR